MTERYWAARQHLQRARTALVVARRRPERRRSYHRQALEAILSAIWLMGGER